jgi:phosphoglucosamine mutase
MGADVVRIGVTPDGFNINDKCGATHTDTLQSAVVAHGADLGIALDGDADRVIMIDEHGHPIDGDQVMALIARSWGKGGKLRGGGVVGTVMSNLGLERFLAAQKLKLARASVGDRYVVEMMRASDYNLGGEQSGHIILSDYATTGDGLVAALQVLAVLVESGQRASELCRVFEPLPQLLKNVRFKGGTPLEADSVKKAIRDAEQVLGKTGRVLIRKSGTEPLIRVMAEGEDKALIDRVVTQICGEIERVAGAT